MLHDATVSPAVRHSQAAYNLWQLQDATVTAAVTLNHNYNLWQLQDVTVTPTAIR